MNDCTSRDTKINCCVISYAVPNESQSWVFHLDHDALRGSAKSRNCGDARYYSRSEEKSMTGRQLGCSHAHKPSCTLQARTYYHPPQGNSCMWHAAQIFFCTHRLPSGGRELHSSSRKGLPVCPVNRVLRSSPKLG